MNATEQARGSGSSAPKVIDTNRRILFKQRVALLVSNTVPALGFGFALARAYASETPRIAIYAFFTLHALCMLGFEAGFHRLFTHRAYRAARPIEALLAVLGSMAAGGTLVGFTATHRRHHALSDRDGDPHSPQLFGQGLLGQVRGLAHAHYGWLFDSKRASAGFYARDILQDRLLVTISRNYYFWVLLGLIGPAVLVGLTTWQWSGALDGFLWGGLARIFTVQTSIYLVNSFGHWVGTRPFARGEHSTNNFLVAIATLGTGWHNNHHAFPSSALAGLRWWQIDISWWFIATLERLGWAWEVNRPSAVALMTSNQKRVSHET